MEEIKLLAANYAIVAEKFSNFFEGYGIKVITMDSITFVPDIRIDKRGFDNNDWIGEETKNQKYPVKVTDIQILWSVCNYLFMANENDHCYFQFDDNQVIVSLNAPNRKRIFWIFQRI